MYAIWHQSNTAKKQQNNTLFGLNAKPSVWGKHNTSLSNCLLIFKHGGGCIMIWVCLTSAKTGEFFRMKINGKNLL